MMGSDEVFVFGSNLAGRHGRGSAKEAKEYWGAEYGVGRGRTGDAYAIPTKDKNLRTLPVSDIKGYVDEFIEYAKDNPDTRFLVSKIGTGLAGYKDEEIAPLFDRYPQNCILHSDWLWIILNTRFSNLKVRDVIENEQAH